jgi:hypothetical protein
MLFPTFANAVGNVIGILGQEKTKQQLFWRLAVPFSEKIEPLPGLLPPMRKTRIRLWLTIAAE